MGKTRRHHNLPEVTRPNLVEDIFPYDLPPLIRFQDPAVEYVDGKPVQFDFAAVKDRDIVITDTTFRDGQQSLPPYTVDQMAHIYDLLSQLGGPNGVIRQTEFFLYTKNDREALDPARLTWVVIGDLAKIEQPIRDLKLGTVQVLDADGNPVR